MSIDPQLLNRDRIQGRKEEIEAGQETRRGKVKNKRAVSGKNKSGEKSGEEEEGGKRRILSKNRGKNNKKEKKEGNILSYPVQKSTKMALRWSWISLLVTGGLSMAFSLAYLNFHLLFRNIMPSFFCKIGEEWSLREEANKARSTAASKMNKRALGFFEVLGIILLDFIVTLLFILMVAVIITVIIVIYKFFGWFQNFFG